MRKQLLAMAAAGAIAGPAAAADLTDDVTFADETFTPTVEPTVKGDIELSFGWMQLDLDGDDKKTRYQLQGWGRANIPLGETLNLLVETGGNSNFEGDDLPITYSNLNAFGHLWGGNDFRYGAFGGATFNAFNVGTMASVGLEAEVDIGNATLGAQGYYTWVTSGCVGDCDAFGANGWLDFYLGPNTKLTGEIQWVKFDPPISAGFEALGGLGRLTHRFAGTPFNVFAEGGYWHLDGSTFSADMVKVTGGITIVLDGNGTQAALDRNDLPFTFRGPTIARDVFLN